MPTAKQEALAALDKLPDDATYEDMQYRLYVLESIREGLASLECEGGLTTEEVKASLGKWLGQSGRARRVTTSPPSSNTSR